MPFMYTTGSSPLEGNIISQKSFYVNGFPQHPLQEHSHSILYRNKHLQINISRCLSL